MSFRGEGFPCRTPHQGLCPWTPLGDFCPLEPPTSKCWQRHCNCAGDILVYAGGQQPHQRVNVGSNFLQAKFTVAAWSRDASSFASLPMLLVTFSGLCMFTASKIAVDILHQSKPQSVCHAWERIVEMLLMRCCSSVILGLAGVGGA